MFEYNITICLIDFKNTCRNLKYIIPLAIISIIFYLCSVRFLEYMYFWKFYYNLNFKSKYPTILRPS